LDSGRSTDFSARARSARTPAATGDLDRADARDLARPQQLQPLGVMLHHVIAHEARRQGHFNGAVADAVEGQRIQPALECSLADLGP